MRRLAVLFAAELLGACAPPAPTTDLPGGLIGSFLFTGTLVTPGMDAGAGVPQTTCDLDGGALAPSATLSFFAGMSEGPDAGQIWWELEGASPVLGSATDGGFVVAVRSTAPVASCNCAAALTETVAGFWPPGDGGSAPSVPVLQITGWLDDRIDPDPADTGGCALDGGAACQFGCDVVYALDGLPGQPGS